MTRLLLVSELFPPVVGGSAELFANVYNRLGTIPVTVLTETAASDTPLRELDGLTVIRERMSSPHWGLLAPAGLAHHLRCAWRLRQLAGPDCAIHCGRALPEGLDAYLARFIGGPPYACWAHGEELAYARSSRELSALLGRVARSAFAMFANSRNTASLVEALGVPSGRIHVVYPGVDSERFRPGIPGAAALKASLGGDGPLLLTIGRLQRRKGHDLVLQALARLQNTHPGVRYVIVGDGDERFRLVAMARDLGVSDRVVWAGKVAASELPSYYAAADVFVHPNRVDGDDFEGFGIVFLEAAAAGLPVIAGTTGGAPEAVQNGVTGELVSGTDVEELRVALDGLLASPERRQEMGIAGRERARRDFSWDRAAAQVAAVHTGSRLR